ncbi:hypothetical protein CXB51_031142 [Gossypium anomalum]|uniref:CCHC-type domain-containing protein n=1 Tax=Gossypium anomalum TaxID=47600 RepID=A0A8J5Y6V6_9ROSI|nr:hypothetical protein CXB51_031142 [Gossypium anomalum]
MGLESFSKVVWWFLFLRWVRLRQISVWGMLRELVVIGVRLLGGVVTVLLKMADDIIAVGKIMAKEKINKEAMHRVFKLLWFTKEEVSLLALNEEVILVKFGSIENRTCIFNLRPWLFDQCLFAMLPFIKGKEIDAYEFNFTSFWQGYRRGGGYRLERQEWRINVLCPLRRVVHLVGRDGAETICAINYERLPAFCYICGLIGHTTQKCPKKDEIHETNNLSFQYRNWLRAQIGGPNQNRGVWRNGIEILDKSSSSHEVNNRSKTGTREKNETMTQKGKARARDEDFISNSPMEKRMSKSANEGMGRIKESMERTLMRALIDWFEESGGWRPAPPSPMKLFCWYCRRLGNPSAVRELKQLLVANNPDVVFLIETKMQANNLTRIRNLCRMIGCLAMSSDGCSGGLVMLWSTLRLLEDRLFGDGNDLVKERLDRFVMTTNAFSVFPFIETNVIRQTKSDHDAVMLDTQKRNKKTRGSSSSSMLAGQKIRGPKRLLKMRGSNILEKFDRVREELGPWQYNRYSKMRNHICKLTEQIDRMTDGPLEMSNANSLKEARIKLGKLYAEEEGYWEQRSKIRWLKEGDRNATFFHV